MDGFVGVLDFEVVDFFEFFFVFFMVVGLGVVFEGVFGFGVVFD